MQKQGKDDPLQATMSHNLYWRSIENTENVHGVLHHWLDRLVHPASQLISLHTSAFFEAPQWCFCHSACFMESVQQPATVTRSKSTAYLVGTYSVPRPQHFICCREKRSPSPSPRPAKAVLKSHDRTPRFWPWCSLWALGNSREARSPTPWSKRHKRHCRGGVD